MIHLYTGIIEEYSLPVGCNAVAPNTASFLEYSLLVGCNAVAPNTVSFPGTVGAWRVQRSRSLQGINHPYFHRDHEGLIYLYKSYHTDCYWISRCYLHTVRKPMLFVLLFYQRGLLTIITVRFPVPIGTELNRHRR